jgi:hypothetical protein
LRAIAQLRSKTVKELVANIKNNKNVDEESAEKDDDEASA